MAAQDGGGGLEKAHLSTQQRRRLSRLWKHCIQGLSTDLLGVTQTIRSKRARKTLCTRGTINTAHNTQHNIRCNLALSGLNVTWGQKGVYFSIYFRFKAFVGF